MCGSYFNIRHQYYVSFSNVQTSDKSSFLHTCLWNSCYKYAIAYFINSYTTKYYIYIHMYLTEAVKWALFQFKTLTLT